ncbi:MAG TPA: AAA family ATPase [Bacteroidales bacterium]|nr:AAA family ATPase [Bacteroidales bacterium]
MSRIKIKNFGPVKKGCIDNDGWIDVKKVTVFIGNQGSGKSTVAKLISTLTWIEKALVRGDLLRKKIEYKNTFENLCAYHNLLNYFQKDGSTSIEFEGESFTFTYKKERFKIVGRISKQYVLPKIMYVPAERNFSSAVKLRNLRKIPELPKSLFTFIEEMERSQNELSDSLELPIGKAKFYFDKLNETANVIGSGYKLKLSETSSGFQSFVPLFLVSKNLANSIKKEKDPTINEMSYEAQKKMQKEVEEIIKDAAMPDEVKRFLLKTIPNKYRNGLFVNIIEEPEQNLFPASQRQMLNSLLEFNNMNEGNKLIMTTHSPYLINYLTLAIKAFTVEKKVKNTEESIKLNEIVPIKSIISPKEIAIYELDESNGTIKKLGNFEGIPLDKNYLNQSLADGNLLFDSLLDIEEGL